MDGSTDTKPQLVASESPRQRGDTANLPRRVKRLAKHTRKVSKPSQIGFPYTDLDTAIALARALLEAGGVPLTRDQLAGAMKLAAGSGNFVIRVMAARQFGLIENKDGKYQLTQLGFSIVDSDDKRQKAARAEAFMSVPLYRRVYDEFKGRQLPPRPHGLEQAFVQFGVTPKQKDKARHAFDRSAREAGFFALGDDRLVEPVIGVSPPSDRPPTAIEPTDKGRRPSSTGLDPLIQGLLDRLPKPGDKWEHDKRLRWLQTLAANLDFVYPPDVADKFVSIESKSI